MFDRLQGRHQFLPPSAEQHYIYFILYGYQDDEYSTVYQ